MIVVWILLAMIGIWLGYEWWEHTRIEYVSTCVECQKLESDSLLKLCLITDLHNNKKKAEDVCKKITGFSPDFILIAGDFVDKRKKTQKNAMVMLEKLAKIAPVFYSFGNHEEELRQNNPGAWKEYTDRLPDGVRLLDNESLSGVIRGKEVCIFGLSLPEVFYRKGKLYHRFEELPEIKGDSPTEDTLCLFLAHHPEYMPLYEKYYPDVVFSGHLHGGLLRLPLIGGVISPRFRIPKEDAGWYHYPFGLLYISRGLGSHTIPLRFFNRVELDLITLHGKMKKDGE